MSLPLRVSGDLRDVDAALLVRSLARSRETGRLAVSEGDLGRSLLFKSGEIVFASSNDPDDGLGAWLVRAGKLTLPELSRLGTRVTPEERLGSVLVEEGRLSPEELLDAVTAQLIGIVEGVVLAERGRYWFDFSDLQIRELIVLRADPRALVLGALRRVSSVGRVRRGLAQLRGRHWLAQPPALLVPLALSPAEERVLAAVGTGWDGAAELEVDGLSSWEVARTLWSLQVVGALKSATALRATPSPLASLLPTPRAPLEVPPEEPGHDAEIERAVREFNDRHQSIFRILRVEVGVAAEGFVRDCLASLPARERELFEAVDYLPLGRFQAGRLLERLTGAEAAGARSALGALIELELSALRPRLGESRLRELRSELGLEVPAGLPDLPASGASQSVD